MSRRVAVPLVLVAAMTWAARGATLPPEGATEPVANAARARNAPSSERDGTQAADVAGTALVRKHLQQPSGQPTLSEKELKTLIATLPDPLASHLDWAFDSHLDAIRRAFERAGYVLDRFEFPWGLDTTADPKLPGTPGAMLFRKAASQSLAASPRESEAAPRHDLWLVYLVGELSTGGIDGPAFELAMKDRAALLRSSQTEPEPLRIVGPVFSGSSTSLRHAIDRSHATSVEVVTGSATSPNNEAAIEGIPGGYVAYSSTLHADDVLWTVLEEHVLGALALEPSEVAILKESTTDYGQSAGAGDASAPTKSGSMPAGTDGRSEPAATDGQSGRAKIDEEPEPSEFLTVPFPMSIGSLRRAVAPVAAPAAPAELVAFTRARSSVGLDVYDERARAETPPSVSPLSPPSIDLLLDSIAEMLSDRGIRGVVLLATDVRDKLFLGSEIRKRLPNVQLFTTESNVLYLRPEFNEWLRGMVVLSTYPLVPRAACWQPQSITENEQLLFANEGAEGTFNAVLVQLGRKDLLADYGWPIEGAGKGGRPPVWATVVGATRMLPLAVYEPLDTRGTQTAAGDASNTADDASTAHRRASGGADTPLSLGVSPSSERSDADHAEREPFLAMLATTFFAVLLLAACLSRVTAWLPRKREPREPNDRLALEIVRTLGKKEPRAWPERHARAQRVALALHHELYTAFLFAALLGLLMPHLSLLLLERAWMGATLRIVLGVGCTAAIVGACAVIWRTVMAASIFARHSVFGFLHVFRSGWPSLAARVDWVVETLLRWGVVVLALGYIATSAWLALRVLRVWGPALDDTALELFLQRAVQVDGGVSPLWPLMLIGLVIVAWCHWHILRIRALDTELPAETALVAEGEQDEPRPRPEIRRKLFQIVPSTAGFGLLVLLAMADLWLYRQFRPTLDDLALGSGGTKWPFGALLAVGVIGALSASIWATYRLIELWRSLAGALREHDATLAAIHFEQAIQESGARVDFGLWPRSRASDLRGFTALAWDDLDAASQEADPAVEPAREAAVAANDGDRAWALRRLLAHVPALRRADDTPRRKAVHGVLALEVVAYVEWVVRHMRWLSFFLLLTLVLTTLLIASYPFQPQQLVQSLSLVVFAAVVAALVWVIGAMSRSAHLSRMAGTTPGGLSLDRTLFSNLALYALVPLVAILSAQFTGVRDTLFEWLKPLVKLLVNA